MGRQVRGGSRRDPRRDQCLDRLRPALVRTGHRRLQGACFDARGPRHHYGSRRGQNRAGPGHHSRRDRKRQVQILASARRHSHERREQACRTDRPSRGPPAYRALAERSGRHRFQALHPRHRRRSRQVARRSATRAQRKGPAIRGQRYAGLHAFADRAARHLRPSSHGLCRDAFARPRQTCRCKKAHERKSAGLGGTRRNVVPDRPRHDLEGARLRPAHREQPGRGVRPRLRAGDA